MICKILYAKYLRDPSLITDVPKEYSSSRIKDALKSFGQIIKLETTETRNNTREKIIQVIIEPLVHSKDLTNRWSIPLDSTIARIVPADLEMEILKDKNQYTARLYGIPNPPTQLFSCVLLKTLYSKHVIYQSVQEQEKKEISPSSASKQKKNLIKHAHYQLDTIIKDLHGLNLECTILIL